MKRGVKGSIGPIIQSERGRKSVYGNYRNLSEMINCGKYGNIENVKLLTIYTVHFDN